ncbi:MAG: hypothetical protein J2P24_09970 [Streptosporangiales bacterium]|nr:hypothetical protein [Streptosporangiales bacterium]MBO0892028.1 hypothetical protein [Acidothermales bacterium]
MAGELGTFRDAPARRGGIPWYAAFLLVIGLGLAASIVDWAIGEGFGVTTGAAFLIGCLVLGGRVRAEQLSAGLVGAPICYVLIIAISGGVQLLGSPAYGTAFRIFWTFALVSGLPWLLGGTALSAGIAGLRMWRRRR